MRPLGSRSLNPITLNLLRVFVEAIARAIIRSPKVLVLDEAGILVGAHVAVWHRV